MILCNDWGAGAGEIESVGFFGAVKVVQLKDEMLGEIELVSPNNPPNTCVDEAKFVARGIDGFNAGQREIPAAP